MFVLIYLILLLVKGCGLEIGVLSFRFYYVLELVYCVYKQCGYEVLEGCLILQFICILVGLGIFLVVFLIIDVKIKIC